MIAIRYKPLRTGGYSIYLDIYDKEKRDRKSLGLWVSKDYSKHKFISKEDVTAVEKARQIANDLSQGEIVPVISEKNKKPLFLEFLMEKECKCNDELQKYKSIAKHARLYSGKKDIPFFAITKIWIEGFQEYLEKQLKGSTINGNLMYLKLRLNEAVKLGYINENPLAGYNYVNFRRTLPFLTDLDIELLISTPTTFNHQIRQSFFFSLYTGLSWEQVSTLTWKQIKISRTDKLETWIVSVRGFIDPLPYTNILPDQVIAILKELTFANVNDNPVNVYNMPVNVKNGSINVNIQDGNVFNRLPNKSNCNIRLRLWGAMAGLDKSLCFSMARYSFINKLVVNETDKRELKRLLNVKGHGTVKNYQRMYNNQGL